MQIPNVLTLCMTISSTNNCWFLESEVVLSGVLFAWHSRESGLIPCLIHTVEISCCCFFVIQKRLAHMDTTFGQWMSTVMLYYVKKISYYAVQKEKLYFLMKYSVQGKPFICDYVII